MPCGRADFEKNYGLYVLWERDCWVLTGPPLINFIDNLPFLAISEPVERVEGAVWYNVSVGFLMGPSSAWKSISISEGGESARGITHRKYSENEH